MQVEEQLQLVRKTFGPDISRGNCYGYTQHPAM